MKKFFFYILFFISFAACQNVERSEKPDDLIPEDKMVNILTELSLLSSARNYNRRLFEQTGIHADSLIYQKYDIDSVQLERSSNYYSENYNQYENIYNRVKDSLEELKVVLDSIKAEETRVKDSIREAEIRVDSIADFLQFDAMSLDSMQIKIDDLIPRDSLTTPPDLQEIQ